MKKLTLSTLLFAFAATGFAQRETISLDRDWYFQLGDKASASITTAQAKEQGWRIINVPHDFQIEQPWVAPSKDEKASTADAGANIKSRLSSRGFKEMGGAWYVKTITPAADEKGKRALLDFQGLIYYGDIYLNGEKVGTTNYGYVPFEIDVTDKLKWGQENTIAVYANTAQPNNSRWYTGGGIFRDVNLVYTAKNLYFNRHPLYITTKDNNSVTISANVKCNTKDNTVKLKATITDPAGKVISDETYDLKRNRNYKVGQELTIPTIALPDAQLWDCEHPNLYTAKVQLLRQDGTVADEETKRFGVRTVEIKPGQGLLLNGKKVLLQGYANHHTLGALGAAAYPRAMEKRIKMMKEWGINHIRTSHNPYSESFLDLCDENGILVVDELYDKWNDQYVGGGREHFTNEWMSDEAEFIQRDRNHPCVVMWSFGNELQSYADQPFNDFGVTQYKLMRTLCERYDSTRKTTVAMHPRYRNWETNDLPCELAKTTDVQSYNYRYMYFPGDGEKFPWMTFYQSEASVAAMGENYFGMDLDKVIGLAYWGVIDYLGESQGWPNKGWNQGVFNIDLTPKPKAYYMRSFFKADEPVVHIAVVDAKGNQMWNGVQTGNDGMSDHWNRTPGQKLDIITYTNADEVELFVNGKSYGVKKNDTTDPKMRNQIRWKDIEYQDGNCEAVARTNGKVVARHKIETTGKAVALKLEADIPTTSTNGKASNHDTSTNGNADNHVSGGVSARDGAYWKADGLDLQHVRVIAVDSKGRKVQTAQGDVKFTITGDAAIAAVSNGDMKSDELNVTDHRNLYDGSCLAILRAGTSPSAITLTATAPGLKPAKIKLLTK